MSKIIAAARRFDNAVKRTVMDEAIVVADAVTDEWDAMDRDTAREIANKIVADYPQASQAARSSEWVVFIIAACDYKLATAIRYARSEMPTFTRVQLFKLARLLPNADDYKAAVEQLKQVAATASKKGAGVTRTVAGCLKQLFAIQTRKQKEIQFRKELAALCNKHGISY